MAMTKIIFALAAVAALASCNKQDQAIVAGGNSDSETVNTAGIVLPPAITASKIYRCKDNSLVYIDWLADNLSANFRAGQTEAPVQLKAAAAGEPMIAEGYSLKGDATAHSITLTLPGKGTETCKA